jgi:hypothetical protein
MVDVLDDLFALSVTSGAVMSFMMSLKGTMVLKAEL